MDTNFISISANKWCLQRVWQQAVLQKVRRRQLLRRNLLPTKKKLATKKKLWRPFHVMLLYFDTHSTCYACVLPPIMLLCGPRHSTYYAYFQNMLLYFQNHVILFSGPIFVFSEPCQNVRLCVRTCQVYWLTYIQLIMILIHPSKKQNTGTRCRIFLKKFNNI